MCLQFPFVLIIVREEVLNAKIQRLPTNSTNTLKFNDCRKKEKMPLRISRRSGTFFTLETRM